MKKYEMEEMKYGVHQVGSMLTDHRVFNQNISRADDVEVSAGIISNVQKSRLASRQTRPCKMYA